MTIKQFYHRTVPPALRYPIGRARRRAKDRWLRWQASGPSLPPPELLESVQMTPWVDEFLAVGERCASSLVASLEQHGVARDEKVRVLDFGCGLGRTLRFIDTAWRLSGSDVDPALVQWSARHLSGVDVRQNDASPPLPWPSHSFRAVWAVSVFTHMDEAAHAEWACELARVLEPGGLAAITFMGPKALSAFPHVGSAEDLAAAGYLFHAVGERFNASGAFHTQAGLQRLFSPHFELLEWIDGGLDDFQGLAMLRATDV